MHILKQGELGIFPHFLPIQLCRSVFCHYEALQKTKYLYLLFVVMTILKLLHQLHLYFHYIV